MLTSFQSRAIITTNVTLLICLKICARLFAKKGDDKVKGYVKARMALICILAQSRFEFMQKDKYALKPRYYLRCT
jgi:hypothetical protein